MTMRAALPVAALALVLGLTAVPAAADTVTLSPSQDNTLFENDGNLSSGSGDSVYSGQTNFFGARRALLAFDVAGAIPAGAAIDAVELRLTVVQTISGDQPMTLHRLLAGWGEAGSISPAGAGVPADTGDATWTHRFYDTDLWATPGGDYVASESATQMVGFGGQYTWGSTPGMVADVQGWLDGGSNFGWILIGNEATNPTAKRFGSSEHPDALLRPELTVTFTPDGGGGGDPGAVPTVSEWGLLLMALLLLTGAVAVFGRRGVAVGTTAGATESRLVAPPFDGGLYLSLLGLVAGLAVAGLALAAAVAGMPTRVDLAGTLLCVPVIAYLLHAWRLTARR